MTRERDLVEHLRQQASQQDMLTCEDMLQAADEIERLRRDLAIWERNGGDILLQAEIERLNAERGYMPELVVALRAEIERLTDAIRRIDGINDNPADYNPAINAVCDAILREPKP